ncbi:adenylate kinase [Leekyejoonella antrihumi]|uniref:Adenylate kinase n=1 Tax=Leekyejoonella antrihumi TaxID=1660198 RepID=A0A563E6C0_9MICO|nr:adenylate kinase [Leekyejoonella antrihumi]TWP37384.1 adenylate kinase [Leekyejoonella antrihumi]
MRLIILGPPGAGKGTQAEQIAASRSIPHISTGDIFRENIKDETPLGLEVKHILDAGGYVTDDITNKIVADRLHAKDCAAGFLLDGYPRTTAQVEALDSVLAADGHRIDAVIELAVPEDELVRRLLARAETSDRSDDTEHVIRERQALYRRETAPLTDIYGSRGAVHQIDGLGTVEEVSKRVLSALDEVADGVDA